MFTYNFIIMLILSLIFINFYFLNIFFLITLTFLNFYTQISFVFFMRNTFSLYFTNIIYQLL